MTIPTGSVDHARDSAKAIDARGIATLKIKVGGTTVANDLDRVRAAVNATNGARVLLDANGAFTPAEALELVSSLREHGVHVALFEQPVRADDLDGLALVTRESGVIVCADESARSVTDVLRLAEKRAATAINIKLMKSGVARAAEMVAIARSAGLELMIGGMVESILAMTFSAHFAFGLGGFSYADLDTPLFIKASPFVGGFVLDRGRVALEGVERGVGVTLR
jgi:L-alanine-DL-glutamate epimerase-like enolase superfamily enzyme